MTIQPVRLFGDPILRARAAEVTEFDRELRQLVADLTDTMEDDGGVGMAAPQIGVGLRVFVYDTGDAAGHLVNPTYTVVGEEEQVGPEGCLSIPGLRYDTRRALRVRASGFDMHGKPVEFAAEKLLARCVQHETDHLDGVLFIDRLDPASRKEAMRTIRESDWFVSGITVRDSRGAGQAGPFGRSR
ncbi:peptide deformylase [Nocardia xishanensis]